MTEELKRFLDLDDYINNNIDVLTVEERERLLKELNDLVSEILRGEQVDIQDYNIF